MGTPSSGTICWSDIQAVAGGGYCMSDFNAASGRGYCANGYYNYNPTPTSCYLYDVYDYGYADFVDCIGTPTYTYTVPGDSFCVSVWYSGPAYNTSLACL